MRVLATDYDGTIAREGAVAEGVVDALRRWRDAGRALILVTGRRLPTILEIFPRIGLFDLVVAENGALLYRPATAGERALAAPPPADFAALLRARGVDPLVTGTVIVAADRAHEEVVREAIRERGLALEISLNKGSVMVLPAGVDKASGLRAALAELGAAPRDVVGVGDAENDLPFLEICGLSVAVADALPELRARCDEVTAGGAGDGMIELVDRLLKARP